MIGRASAEGALREVYEAMDARPLPAVYRAPGGEAPGILRAHSLDPALMRVVFGTSGATHAKDGLPWAERELLAAVASRVNQCLY